MSLYPNTAVVLLSGGKEVMYIVRTTEFTDIILAWAWLNVLRTGKHWSTGSFYETDVGEVANMAREELVRCGFMPANVNDPCEECDHARCLHVEAFGGCVDSSCNCKTFSEPRNR